MTTAGWILMSIAWGSILALAIFCYTKILRDNDRECNQASDDDRAKVY